jgi:hypothetical protein
MKAHNFIVSLCHWLITLTRSPKPNSTIKCAHLQGEVHELQQSQENLWESQGNQTAQVAFT